MSSIGHLSDMELDEYLIIDEEIQMEIDVESVPLEKDNPLKNFTWRISFGNFEMNIPFRDFEEKNRFGDLENNAPFRDPEKKDPFEDFEQDALYYVSQT